MTGIGSPNAPTFTVWGLIASSYRLLSARFSDFIRMMWLPALVSVLVSGRARYQADNAEGTTTLFMQIWGDLFPIVVIVMMWLTASAASVAVHRLILLGEAPPRPLGLQLDRRALLYMGYNAAVVVIAMMPLGLVAAVFSGLASGAAWEFLLLLPMAAGAIFTLALMVRLTLVLPAVAIDRQRDFGHSLRTAWMMSKGVTVKFAVAIILAMLPLGVIQAGVAELASSDALSSPTAMLGGMIFIALDAFIAVATIFIQLAIITHVYGVQSRALGALD